MSETVANDIMATLVIIFIFLFKISFIVFFKSLSIIMFSLLENSVSTSLKYLFHGKALN